MESIKSLDYVMVTTESATDILEMFGHIFCTAREFTITETDSGYCCDRGQWSHEYENGSSSERDVMWTVANFNRDYANGNRRVEFEFVPKRNGSPIPDKEFPIYVSIRDNYGPEHTDYRFELVSRPLGT